MKQVLHIATVMLFIGLCGTLTRAQDVSVVWTVPRNQSHSIHPSLRHIVIEFGSPVMCDSIVVAPTEFGILPVADGAPYFADAQTLVLPVTLSPGQCYSLGINTGREKPFRSRFDPGITVRPDILTFTTIEQPSQSPPPNH